MKHLIPLIAILLQTALHGATSTPGTLASDTQIPLVVDGKSVGSMTLKAGSEVTITQVLANNEGVIISRGDTTVQIPAKSLSPESLQAATAAQTAEKASQVAAAATPAPTLMATAAVVSTNSKVSKEELAFYQKVESLIKNGHKIANDPDCPLLNYACKGLGKEIKDIIGETLTKDDFPPGYGYLTSLAPLKINQVRIVGQDRELIIIQPDKSSLPKDIINRYQAMAAHTPGNTSLSDPCLGFRDTISLGTLTPAALKRLFPKAIWVKDLTGTETIITGIKRYEDIINVTTISGVTGPMGLPAESLAKALSN